MTFYGPQWTIFSFDAHRVGGGLGVVPMGKTTGAPDEDQLGFSSTRVQNGPTGMSVFRLSPSTRG